MNVKINDKKQSDDQGPKSNKRRPTFDENKFLTNCRTVAFDTTSTALYYHFTVKLMIKHVCDRNSPCSSQAKKVSIERHRQEMSFKVVTGIAIGIGLASDDVTKHSNVCQWGKIGSNKDSVPYKKNMLAEKSLTGRSSLFLRGEVWKVLTTLSQLSASHFKRYGGLDKCGAVLGSINDLPACFCMGRYFLLEPSLAVATPVAAPWHSTCKPYSLKKKRPKQTRSKWRRKKTTQFPSHQPGVSCSGGWQAHRSPQWAMRLQEGWASRATVRPHCLISPTSQTMGILKEERTGKRVSLLCTVEVNVFMHRKRWDGKKPRR